MKDRPRILVVGEGGREHALAWRLAQDPERPEVLVTPGNDGIARTFRTLPIPVHDHAAIADACAAERVDLCVVGPDAPIAAGLGDRLRARGVHAFAPSAEAARLESSKAFAKQVMAAEDVPTARAEAFDTLDAARAALPRFGPPWVLKADGLAAGKGVRVTGSRDEAEAFLSDCLESSRFGAAGRTVLLEEHLEGEEASMTVLCSGLDAVALHSARDHKRALDGDRGPNTGGMGAVAPHPRVSEALEREVLERIVRPVLRHLAARGTPFHGTLYPGLMLTEAGPRVVEFNARFGDPESQVVLPLTEGSLSTALDAVARGQAIDGASLPRAPGAAVTVALVDEEYPATTRGGGVIEGLDRLEAAGEVLVFHAGTAWRDGRWTVRAGRAAYITVVAATREAARDRAYAAIEALGGAGWRCRRDVAAETMTTTIRGGR